MKSLRTFSLAVAGLWLVALGACGEKEPVRIGFIGGLSGRNADLGESGRNGTQLAIEERNGAGGINGRKIELVARDDGQSPGTAADSARQLIAAGVQVIVGPMNTAMVQAVQTATEPARIVVVSPTIATLSLAGQDDHLFRINATTRDFTRLYADKAYQQGLRRIAVAYDTGNRGYTESWLNEFRTAFEARGGQVVAASGYVSSDSLSLEAVLSPLLAARPDGLAFVSSTLDAARLAQQARKQSSSIALFTAEWAATDQLLELGGQTVEGMGVVIPYNRDDASPGFQRFQKAFRERFKREPSYGAVAAYDGTNAVLDALSRRREAQTVKEALVANGPYQGLQQAILFDRFGDTQRNLHFSVVRNGHFVIEK